MSVPVTGPTPDEARDLLARAGGIGNAMRSGVSWPFVTVLLGLGAISSLAVAALWLARQTGQESFVHYPIWLMLAWLGVFLAIGIPGARSSKRGFARRWGISIAVWAALWTVSMFVPGFIGDPLWFSILMSALLLVTTVALSLWELRA